MTTTTHAEEDDHVVLVMKEQTRITAVLPKAGLDQVLDELGLTFGDFCGMMARPTYDDAKDYLMRQFEETEENSAACTFNVLSNLGGALRRIATVWDRDNHATAATVRICTIMHADFIL
jgi:hypothetical protein